MCLASHSELRLPQLGCVKTLCECIDPLHTMHRPLHMYGLIRACAGASHPIVATVCAGCDYCAAGQTLAPIGLMLAPLVKCESPGQTIATLTYLAQCYGQPLLLLSLQPLLSRPPGLIDIRAQMNSRMLRCPNKLNQKCAWT